MDEQKLVVVTDSLQSTSFTFLAVTWRNIVWSFSVPMWWNKHFPGQSASIYCFKFLGCLSLRVPSEVASQKMFLGKIF